MNTHIAQNASEYLDVPVATLTESPITHASVLIRKAFKNSQPALKPRASWHHYWCGK
jgi:hypothetical protein